jgi:penicillin-binding protein 2
LSSVGERPRIPRFLPPDPRVEEPYRVTPPMALRIAILGFVAILLFAALFFRLWALQVISGERYLEEARNNQVRTFRAPATRGTISDRDGDLLVSNVPGTAIQVWPAALEEMPSATRSAVIGRVSRLLGVPAKEIRVALRRHANDPLTPVTIKEGVGDAKVQYLLEHQARFPGVQVAQTELRNYEQGVLASQLLGYVGEISAEQLEERRRKGYAVGDRIGQTGIESAYDRYLRGVPGVGQVRVDALGRITSDREFSQLPESGYSLRLTLDDDLQRAAEGALGTASGSRSRRGSGRRAAARSSR